MNENEIEKFLLKTSISTDKAIKKNNPEILGILVKDYFNCELGQFIVKKLTDINELHLFDAEHPSEPKYPISPEIATYLSIVSTSEIKEVFRKNLKIPNINIKILSKVRDRVESVLIKKCTQDSRKFQEIF